MLPCTKQTLALCHGVGAGAVGFLSGSKNPTCVVFSSSLALVPGAPRGGN